MPGPSADVSPHHIAQLMVYNGVLLGCSGTCHCYRSLAGTCHCCRSRPALDRFAETRAHASNSQQQAADKRQKRKCWEQKSKAPRRLTFATATAVVPVLATATAALPVLATAAAAVPALYRVGEHVHRCPAVGHTQQTDIYIYIYIYIYFSNTYTYTSVSACTFGDGARRIMPPPYSKLNASNLRACNRPHCLVVRTSCRGRDNPGSTPGVVNVACPLC